MKKFEPSEDFVARVMTEVHTLESVRKEPFLSHPPVWLRWGLSVAGMLLGAANLARFWYSLIFPVVCK